MTTIIIDDKNYERFKRVAKNEGIVYQLIDDEKTQKTFHQTLLGIPKSDDDEDIFARDYVQDNAEREIDWSE